MKTVIITGAGGGLGLKLAATLHEQLPDTILVCQYRNRGEKELRTIGDRIRPRRADLADEAGAEDVARFAADFDNVWGVVNLAGGNEGAPIRKVEPGAFLSAFRKNVITAHNMNRAAVPYLSDGGGGRIVNISSVVARTGAIGATPYAAAKAAVEGYTRSLSLELARHSITVNCLRLGYFDAGLIEQVPEAALAAVLERTTLKRLGDPGLELAAGVRFLLGEDASFITGQVLEVSGGLA
jgi:acetoacetyl-CoA reductase